MNIPLIFQTVKHLRLTQIVNQLRYRFYQPKLGARVAPEMTHVASILADPIVKPKCYEDGQFAFLNISDCFHDWNVKTHGPLWAYNLNYMDWLEQESIATEECLSWIDRFIDELPDNRVGLDPYPIALRVINWVKFFCKNPDSLDKRRCDSMYTQAMLLSRKLEYHLLGNHLLEDAYALFIASVFFNDKYLYVIAEKLLTNQLQEQILADGAHFEQSPMYHCIMLDRLLDCVNFSESNLLFEDQERLTVLLRNTASEMLGHLQSIVYKDGSIPLLNDSADGIAPTADQLFQYAERLHLSWKAMPLKECGYRKLGGDGIEVLVDIGNITASYQPGHSHADTFNYELRIDGQPVIVDTGISTYNKDARRQYERSTAAHNTVVVGGQDSSRVWGGFRVGRRAEVTVLEDKPNELTAYHNGFGRQAIHQRRFFFNGKSLCVEDEIIGRSGNEAISYVHFSPGIHVEFVSEPDGVLKAGDIMLKIKYFKRLQLKKDFVSSEYNNLQQSLVLEMKFAHLLQYEITKTTEQ